MRLQSLILLLVAIVPSPLDAQLPGAKLVSLTDRGGCVVMADDEVRCFGMDPLNAPHLPQTVVPGMRRVLGTPTGIVDVATTSSLGCARTARGELHCWGNKYAYEDTPESTRRRDVCDRIAVGPERIACFDALEPLLREQRMTSHFHARGVADFDLMFTTLCIAERSGRLRCEDTRPTRHVQLPRMVRLPEVRWSVARHGRAVAVDVSNQVGCAVSSSGFVFCWGALFHVYFPTGDVETTDVPQRVPGISDVVDVSVGMELCFLHRDGTVSCLSYTDSDATTNVRVVPGLSSVRKLVRDGRSMCAITAHGKTLCWGENQSGQLGLGDLEAHVTPVNVRAYEGATDIAMTSDGACAAVAGELQCAGDARDGVFGARIPTPRDAFEPIRDASGRDVLATAVAALENASCLRRADGGTWACTAVQPEGTSALTLRTHFEGRTDVESIHDDCVRESSGRLSCELDVTTRLQGRVCPHGPCVLDATGALHCVMQRGALFSARERDFVRVARTAPVMDFTCTVASACSLVADGTVQCTDGEGADDTPSGFVGVAAADLAGDNLNTCVRTRENEVRCRNARPDVVLPQGAQTGPAIVDLEISHEGFCYLESAKTLVCTYAGRSASVANVSRFSMADSHVVALLEDRRVVAFGPYAGAFVTGAAPFLLTTPTRIPLDVAP